LVEVAGLFRGQGEKREANLCRFMGRKSEEEERGGRAKRKSEEGLD
jgi:hypothetical protein